MRTVGSCWHSGRVSFDGLLNRDEVAAVQLREARPGERAAWPDWLGEALVARLESAGLPAPWQHQAQFADLLFRGEHAAICTPTGSGKSLAYAMPILAATVEGRLGVELSSSRARLTRARHTAIYLSPTKGLAHDQARAAASLGPSGWPISVVDGDSTQDERVFARDHASFVLTNPDMLHFSVLPNHRRWASFLGALRYIVIDEAHRYQGLFGAHVAHVIRRLRRLAAFYGASPVVALSSATIPNAGAFCGELIGEQSVAVVGDDTSPTGPRTVVLWRPAGSLRSDTASLLAGLSDSGAQTIAFVTSRQSAELVSLEARKIAREPGRIAAYRGGYLPLDRRDLEAGLQDGRVTGLVSTNALELGVDVAGMDAVLVSGYPGKMSSFWQQAGRAGRRGRHALVVLLASDNPLDAYLLEHPELVFDTPVEAPVLHADNTRVLGLHLVAAAQEIPLTTSDARWFGSGTTAALTALVSQAVLRDRGGRYFWTRPERAVDFIDLRCVGGAPFDIVEAETGRVIGVVDAAAVDRTLFPGAVYLHQAETFVVSELVREERYARVHTGEPRYYTQAQSTFEVSIVRELARRPLGITEVCFGEIRLDSQVRGYLRRDELTHEVWDSTELELPLHSMGTQALWWSVPEDLVSRLGWQEPQLGAAAHALEHTAIALLPAFAPCDRWDIGGVSMARHPATGLPTVFVHDGAEGGSGFAARGYEVVEGWLAATLERLCKCACDDGCPSCIVSPKCGNANQILSKSGARELLGLLLGVE